MTEHTLVEVRETVKREDWNGYTPVSSYQAVCSCGDVGVRCTTAEYAAKRHVEHAYFAVLDLTKYKQATLAYLKRLPKSEWGNYDRIVEMLFGEPHPGPRKINITSRVLDALQEEGLVERTGHRGWRLVESP